MSHLSARQCTTVADLARQIEDDIRKRGLKVGDSYLTTAETAKMLRAGMGPVTQALQLLAKRKVIQRKQRIGTIVGENIDASENSLLRVVRILMYDPHVIEEGLFSKEFLFGLQSAVPEARVQFDIVPFKSEEESRYLRSMLEESLANRHSEGFILCNSTVQIQVAFRDSGLPVVVAGSLYGSSQGLPFIDRDQKQIGRLLAEYLLTRGHRHILMVTRQTPGFGPGEYLVADSVAEVLTAADLPATSFSIRNLPHDPAIVHGEIRHFLQQAPDRPGILVRPWNMVEPICEAIKSVGLEPYRDVAIAVADYHAMGSAGHLPDFPFVRSAMTPEEHGFQCGQMLLDRVRNITPSLPGILIPVRLQVPPLFEK